MREAIRIGLTHLGQTATNPSVGCVIVADGEIIGEAVTAAGGRPHAETQALAKAGERARGATAYVTLEPCSHFGKTPPCANALVDAGIARVVVALTDPDPRVSGRGLQRLEDAGVLVETGILRDEARRALSGYLTRQIKGRAQVVLKLAVSADGMLGRPGEEVAITGREVRTEVHRLRAESDAVLIGIGTALADDPDLTVRIEGLERRSPLRIVLDRGLRLSPQSRLAVSARQVPVMVVTEPDREAADAGFGERRRLLEEAGVEVVEAVDLASLLRQLALRGLSSVMVEGGATVASAFLSAGLVDRIDLYTSARQIGPGGIESPLTAADIPDGFVLLDEKLVGEDCLRRYERAL